MNPASLEVLMPLRALGDSECGYVVFNENDHEVLMPLRALGDSEYEPYKRVAIRYMS